ncbi:hypothetical protein RBB78_24450 [Tunturiibacter empetritectus]|uniref:hypothetical protein n=1 Tax=Tunturiibacter empetritectus TaxID=3069691 RepID=UPI003D9B26CA
MNAIGRVAKSISTDLIAGSAASHGPGKFGIERAADQEQVGGFRFCVAGKIQSGEANARSDKTQHENSVLPIAFFAGADEILSQAGQIALPDLFL